MSKIIRHTHKPNEDVCRREFDDWLEYVRTFSKVHRVAPVLFTKTDDSRPYLEFSVGNKIFSGLLDSGSNCCILGMNSHLKFLSDGYKLERIPDSISNSAYTADGSTQKVIGAIDIPVTCDNVTKIIKFMVIPQFDLSFILGFDFWIKFDLAKELWRNIIFVNEIKVKTCSITCAAELSPSENRLLKNTISLFEDISYEKKGLGLTHLVKHKIKVTSDPFKQRYWPLSPAKQKELFDEVDVLLKENIIQPSKSPWCSPVLAVEKRDGSTRLCLDSRRLNSITIRDSYPLPYPSRILDSLRGARFISTIDLSKAFLQIALEDSSKEKTAFVVPGRGLFEFIRTPFGLTNAPAELQRLVDRLFGPEFDNILFCYLDDLILVTDDFKLHIEYLNKINTVLKEAGLTVNLKKCEFCKDRLRYLGYIVDKDGLHTDPSKLDTIENFPRPDTVRQLRSFLGMCSYYRRFICKFADIASPLTRLTAGSKNSKRFIIWSDEAEIAFINLKQALTGSLSPYKGVIEKFYAHLFISRFSFVSKQKLYMKTCLRRFL